MSNIVSNKSYRELLETKNVFADPAYCREAWKSVGTAILLSPAIGCIGDIDTRDGNIEQYTYEKLTKELKKVGRAPTELEMIFHCQAARARFDTSAAVFVRDTVGAKPVDESKVTVGKSQYEELSDDELEALLRYRNSKNNSSKTYEAESVAHTDDTADGTDTTTPTETTEDSGTIADTADTTIAPTEDDDSIAPTVPAAPIVDAESTAEAKQ